MIWATAVTTVPSRFGDLLPKTLESLAKAGFENPHLFIDGEIKDVVPEYLHPYTKTFRFARLRTFGNWVMAAWELYLRNPKADRFVIFQDDLEACTNLKEYLEKCEYPAKGYLNLLCFPENEKPKKGWYLSNQDGKGAVGLVFSNEALRTLLAQPHMVNRPLDAKRGHCSIDGGIVTAMKDAGWFEYVHNPSLIQHTGNGNSSMGHAPFPIASTYLGAEFDALTLLEPRAANIPKSPSSRPTKRIGLVGYHCNTGLGELNRQIATYAEIDKWLVKPHNHEPMKNPLPLVDTWVCPEGAMTKLTKFLQGMDTVLFCETPYYNHLIPLAKSQNKRVVCVPMMEWMPAGAKGWPTEVDLFICPTKHCYDQFAHVVPCVYFPWPVDVERFQFKPRATCNKFLFLAGHGGFNGRKGMQVIQDALKIWPEFPLVSHTQQAENKIAENSDLYNEGDVLICPHSVDGLGLEPMEAMSCGMPVITTDGQPWNEIPSIAKLPAKIEQRKVKRPVDWYLPDPQALVDICKGLLGKPILQESQAAREWAESRSWNKHAEQFTELVRNGVAC